MTDGHLFDLIRELIELEKKIGERPDSIEFGPANRRCKVYFNATDPEKAAGLIDAVKTLAERTLEEPKPPLAGGA